MSEERLPDHPPSMETLLSSADAALPLALYGRDAVKQALRETIARGETRQGPLLADATAALELRFAPTLTRVINATGVLLHTNLGRSPLSASARLAVAQAEGYCTLELDASAGGRGRRQEHVRRLACELFGAEAAFAANNNAGALFLALCALARGRKVLVSRGELVAIGGSFKIPEILEASGAVLAEVGTTNRTTLEDYRRALSPEVALLLTVHPSNYEIRGYASRPEPSEIGALAREAGIPWLHDQGTGCVVPLDEFGVPGEPTVARCLADGADLVAFSGDKLLAGPQAGLLVGRADLVGRIACHPVARAVRPDKTTLAALAATLSDWTRGRWREFFVYRAAAQPLERLIARGESIASAVAAKNPGLRLEVVASEAVLGGGTSPEKAFPSRALAAVHHALPAVELASQLRRRAVPVVARIEEGRVRLDLRSIDPAEDPEVATALSETA